ncbi:Fibrinogen- domains (FReDs) [Branchiostoma belcheri]|nr:Fibrinogen- domains (FReDs) [Branchiostoma belcheri]
MDMAPHKETLVALWERGMKSNNTQIGKELVEEAIQTTGLEKWRVLQWMHNYRTKLISQETQSQEVQEEPHRSITAKRKTNGYDLFRKEHLAGKSGASATRDAGYAWSAIKDTALGKEYEEKAKKIKLLEPKDCDSRQKQKEIRKLYSQLNETLQKLQACGCDAVAAVYNHNTKDVYVDGTPEGSRMMPNLAWDFGVCFGGPGNKPKDGTDGTKALKEEVMALLTEKWRLTSGKSTRFPYAALKRGEVSVEGLPEDFNLKKPGEMGREKLQVILDRREEISVKPQSAEGLSSTAEELLTGVMTGLGRSDPLHQIQIFGAYTYIEKTVDISVYLLRQSACTTVGCSPSSKGVFLLCRKQTSGIMSGEQKRSKTGDTAGMRNYEQPYDMVRKTSETDVTKRPGGSHSTGRRVKPGGTSSDVRSACSRGFPPIMSLVMTSHAPISAKKDRCVGLFRRFPYLENSAGFPRQTSDTITNNKTKWSRWCKKFWWTFGGLVVAVMVVSLSFVAGTYFKGLMGLASPTLPGPPGEHGSTGPAMSGPPGPPGQVKITLPSRTASFRNDYGVYPQQCLVKVMVGPRGLSGPCSCPAPTAPPQVTTPAAPTAPPQVTTPAAPTAPPQVTTPAAPTAPPQVTTPAAPTTPPQVTTPAAPTAPPQVTTPAAPTAPQVTTPAAPTAPPQVTTPAAPTAPPQVTTPAAPTAPPQVTTPAAPTAPQVTTPAAPTAPPQVTTPAAPTAPPAEPDCAAYKAAGHMASGVYTLGSTPALAGVEVYCDMKPAPHAPQHWGRSASAYRALQDCLPLAASKAVVKSSPAVWRSVDSWSVQGGTRWGEAVLLGENLVPGVVPPWQYVRRGGDGRPDFTGQWGLVRGGWTVIQRRLDGSVFFNRTWEEYKHGFGNKNGEYWLGNENIHRLTTQKDYILRIDMMDWDGNKRYAEYNTFRVSGESEQYRLTISGYSGTAGDTITDSYSIKRGGSWQTSGQMFSTVDRDNDGHIFRSCSQRYGQGGGWYRNGCGGAKLNGRYLGNCGNSCPHAQGVTWYDWRGHSYSLNPKRSGTLEMVIKHNNGDDAKRKPLLDLCKTRCAERHKPLEMIAYSRHLDKYGERFADWDTGNRSAAHQTLKSITSFDFIVVFLIVYHYLSHLAGITVKLHGRAVDVVEAHEMVAEIQDIYRTEREGVEKLPILVPAQHEGKPNTPKRSTTEHANAQTRSVFEIQRAQPASEAGAAGGGGSEAGTAGGGGSEGDATGSTVSEDPAAAADVDDAPPEEGEGNAKKKKINRTLSDETEDSDN